MSLLRVFMPRRKGPKPLNRGAAVFAISVQLLSASYSPSATASPSAPTSPRTPPGAQLNVPGFAYCLYQEAPQVELQEVRATHRLGESDLLLLYLSVYPGRRLLLPMSLLQDSAHARWAVAFSGREGQLAERLRSRIGSSDGSLSPSRFFRDAIIACEGDIFCAALISHNVLRTLGRHAQAVYRGPSDHQLHDLNPQWFISERSHWVAQIPQMQRLLMSLRPDRAGDGWGEWYHFYGILAFTMHELALRHGTASVEAVVRLNELLNPILAGGPETAEKARLDRDSIEVHWAFLSGQGLAKTAACDERESYAADSPAVSNAIE